MTMCEILFRGKTDKGEWVYGQLLYFKASVGTDELAIIVESCEWDNSNEWFNLGKRANVIPETVGQYTGFTANDTKIFDGDICKSSDGVFVVRWNKDKCAFVMNFFDYPNEELYMEEMLDDTEVIGNIYDNAELIGEQEKWLN